MCEHRSLFKLRVEALPSHRPELTSRRVKVTAGIVENSRVTDMTLFKSSLDAAVNMSMMVLYVK